jgi:hypothetical protein
MICGYARVSTDGQSVEAQVATLRKHGAERVFREVASGAKTDRAQLRPIQSIDIEAGMRRFVFFTLATVAVVAIAIAAGWRSWTDILSGPLLIGTQKVNQVTGDPAGSGITGTDLGSPVQWKNNLYFLFGDTRDTDPDQFDEHPKGFDAVAVGPVSWDIERDHCLVAVGQYIERDGCAKLEYKTDGTHFQPIELEEQMNGTTVKGPLGVFETPISGVASEDSLGNSTLYAFFSLRRKSPGCPRLDDGCALADNEGSSGGRTVLARSTDDGINFHKVSDVSTGKFQWPVAVVRDIQTIPGLADRIASTGKVAVIFAAGREAYHWRHGYPFLAVVPLQEIEHMQSWHYFSRILGNGKPEFTSSELGANPLPPFGHESIVGEGQPPYHMCVGDLSVGYIEQWGKWAMLYGCFDDVKEGYNKNNGRGIYLRTADVPWGPWSGPKLIFKPSDGYCYFMYQKEPCAANLPNPKDLGMQVPKGNLNWGGEYAPMLLPTYTKVAGDTTNLYFLMSTWNPHQIVLMRTVIKPLRISLSTRVFDVVRGIFRQP